MKKTIKNIADVYLGIPKLTRNLLPIVVLDHIIMALCLNLPAFFKKAEHLHYDQIGQFISIYYWGCLIGALAGGGLTLFFRTTKISGVGLFFLSIGLFCLFNTNHYWVIFCSMFSLGCIGTTVATSNITSLLKSVNQNEKIKLKVISIDLILFNLCYSIATYIMLDLSPSNVVFVIHVLCFFLVLGGGWLLTKCQSALFDVTKEPGKNKKISLPTRKLEFFLLISMVFGFGLIFSMVKVVFTPTLLERFGSNMVSVTVASINPWVVFIFQPLIVYRIKNSNSTWFLGFGSLIVGISYFLFGNVTGFSITAMTLILLTFGEMMFAPLSKHFNIQMYGKGKEGVAAGIWKAVFLGSGVIGSEVSGYFADRFGAYIIWDFCALLGIFCFILSCFLRRIKRREEFNRAVIGV